MAEDIYGPIYTAIKFGDTETVETYLQSIETVTYPILKKIDNFLAHAVNHSQLEVLKLLVNYNAEINRPFDGSFLLETAIQRGDHAITLYLRGDITDDETEETC